MKRASVIIPLYNSAQYIRQVLDFLTAYHHAYETEIIVVDDGSTDGSVSTVRQYGDAIRLVELGANRGRSFARNRGIEAAAGRVCIFLDADCVPQDEVFFQRHLAFHDDQVGALNGQVVIPEHVVNTPYLALRRQERSARGLHAQPPNAFATGNVSVPRELLQQAGGFDEQMKLFEDVDMGFRLAELGVPIYRDDRIIVEHLDVRLTLPRDMKRNYLAYRESVPKIVARNPEHARHLQPLAVITRGSRSPWTRLIWRHLFKLEYRLFQRFAGVLHWRLARMLVRHCFYASAYNGYYQQNDRFFDGLEMD